MSRQFSPLFVAPVVAFVLVAAACGGAITDPADTGASEPAPADTTKTEETTTTSEVTTTTGATASIQSGEGQVVAVGDTVSVHYVGTLDSGERFDSSRDRGTPLTFSVGSGQMIAGFDDAVRGMRIGEIKTVRLSPTEAYGEPDPAAFVEVRLEDVPEGTQVGDQLIGPSGQAVLVTEINGTTVVIDTNHRLAGEFLTFEIEVVSIES